MEVVLTLCLFIVIIILIVNQKKSIVEETAALREDIRSLREQLSRMELINRSTKTQEVKKEIPKPDDTLYKKPLTETLYVVSDTTTGGIVEQTIVEEHAPRPLLPKDSIKAPDPVIVQLPKVMPSVPPPTPPPPKPGFFERHPDLEKFIGENLVSKIGIAILVLAIGFFVKYAIDNNWIGAAGRVAIGILCGGILTALAHIMRKNYQAFSSVLVGGGLAIFYFTITLAYHEYHLFNQVTTFIIMLVITAFAVMLSILYNRQELAVIALVGGFATPFMASNGSGDYISLFIYLITLNTGLLFIAYRKSWRLLNLLAFIFTIVLFASWLITLPSNTIPQVYRNGFIFATIFYVLFLGINIAYNIKENKRFIASDFGILLANTCLYFSAGLYMLTQMEATPYRGLFSACMGIFNLVLSYILFRNKKVDGNILYLLIGITLTFISLTAPIQLNGNNITLFWASEAVLLYWLYLKSGIKIIWVSSVIVWIAMLISLLLDWGDIYGDTSVIRTIMANKGFITTLYASLSCFVLWILKKKDTTILTALYASMPGRLVYLLTSFILLYASGALEINHQFVSRYPDSDLHSLYLLLYSLAFVLVFTTVTTKIKLFTQIIYVAALYAAGIVWYFISISETFSIQYHMLEKDALQSHFIAHYISAVLVGIIMYRLIQLLRSGKITGIKNYTILTIIICVAIVAFLSLEGALMVNNIFYPKSSFNDLHRIYIKTGLPILWGICSFALMWLGMHFKLKTLRIISLALFSITLLKLFIFDIRNIPVAGKIAAFFCLGVLLLIVSFMYQRLKKIIIEDESIRKTE
jgi:hypothetical protein